MNEYIIQKLLDSDLFSGFKHDKLFKILLSSNSVLRHFEKDRLIMLRGDHVEDLIIIIEGRILAHINSLKGKMLRIEILKAPQAVASGILFATDTRLPVSLLAETDVDLLFISKETVFTLCQQNREFMNKYFTDMGDKISLLAEKIRLFQFNTIRQKIAGYLLGLSGPRGLDTIKLIYSKEVLAEIMGVTRPSLSREFSNLAAEGLIGIEGKNIKLLERESLEDILYQE